MTLLSSPLCSHSYKMKVVNVQCVHVSEMFNFLWFLEAVELSSVLCSIVGNSL